MRPQLVNMEKAVDEYKISNYMVGKSDTKKISESGIIAETTKEKGEKYYDAVIKGLLKLVYKLENDPIIKSGT